MPSNSYTSFTPSSWRNMKLTQCLLWSLPWITHYHFDFINIFLNIIFNSWIFSCSFQSFLRDQNLKATHTSSNNQQDPCKDNKNRTNKKLYLWKNNPITNNSTSYICLRIDYKEDTKCKNNQ